MNPVIGTSVSRKDGRAKVTGAATYAADHPIPGLLHGYLMTSTIARGKIQAIDSRKAERAPGVKAIFTSQNPPPIFKPANDFVSSKIYEARLPLSDNTIYYGGQIIGLVVADSFERAREAAHLVEVEYLTETPLVDDQKANYQEAPPLFGEEMKFQTGQWSLGNPGIAATTLQATYRTSTELHAPMEPHAIIAQWQGQESLTVYEPTQWVSGSQRTYAQLFGLATERVHMITPYLGGGFGSKVFPWPHAILCVAAARQLGQPLKVVVSRRQMTANTGHRSQTEQTIRLGANPEGMLQSVEHEVKSCTSMVDVFTEPCTGVTPAMYATPNLRLNQQLAMLNIGTPTFMRAPGENPGLWALESAMDELAWALQIDPVALRLKNETKEHQRKGLPFSAKHFTDCLQVGAERFGWSNRAAQARSQKQADTLIGWGMAGSTFPGLRRKSSAKVRLLPDGTAHVLTSGNDMGTGAYTVVAAIAAETLGIPVGQVRVEMGDSLLPDGGLAGGSQMTASLTPAVQVACQEVLKAAKVTTANEAFTTLRQSGQAAFEATASSAPGTEAKEWAFQSWGAHFCEVCVDEEIGRVRVNRWLAVMDIGQVINAKTAASQVRGAVIMGIGQALMEESYLDPNSGHPVVYDLATYHYPAHADIPRIEVIFVGEPDLNFNPLGARGVGEIGITGVAPAITNAIYHATGKRFRNLPITPAQFMT